MKVFLIVVASAAMAMSAFAQQQPANPNAQTPAVVTPNSPPSLGAPAAGANSFTETQAKSRLETSGYSNVTNLAKDSAGVRRGKASKGSQTVDVSVDYQGNVTPQ